MIAAAVRSGAMAELDNFSPGALPLDRSSSAPLWAQLEQELRRRLAEQDMGISLEKCGRGRLRLLACRRLELTEVNSG